MVHATQAARAGRSAGRVNDPRPPHPSWRAALTGTGPDGHRPDRGQIDNASDFWRRLGI